MDFNLSFIQTQLQDSARRMLEDKLSPELIRKSEDAPSGFPESIWNEGVQLGWPGIALPEEFWRRWAVNLLDMCVLAEEIGRGGATLPLVASSGIAATMLLRFAHKREHRDRYLNEIAAGKIIVPALIDVEGRNEWEKKLRLPINSDGQLSGKKILVPFAGAADTLLVTAVTDDGGTAIVAVNTKADGVAITRHHTAIGVPLFSVEFKDVLLSDENILCQGADAEAALHAGLQIGSLLATAEAIGLAEALIAMATEYVSVREAFGQPIGAFQAVAHPCADMRINTDVIRLLVHEAAWLLDGGRDAAEEIASTKALSNEEFARLANDAFRVHGAIAYSKEYDLQLFYRRLQGLCQTLGETQDSFERAAVVAGI